MNLPKMIVISGIALFGVIAIGSWMKHSKGETASKDKEIVQEIQINQTPLVEIKEKVEKKEEVRQITNNDLKALPEANLIDKLFAFDSSKLDVVETVTYTSRVPWLKGRPAWIADYASYYETTRHFIARSLNRKVDYFTQKVAPGDRFNVLKKNVSFHLLIDLSKAKMWFFAINADTQRRILLKTYRVGLGRKDTSRSSGSLTPIGKYSIGSKVAIYKPGTMGYFQDRKIEMIRVFGTRWIPFDKEIENCSERAAGFGIHGAPFIPDKTTGMLVEDRLGIGQFSSDGCIRLVSEDIEEIFAIVISKPTVIELVKDYFDAKLPGEEK